MFLAGSGIPTIARAKPWRLSDPAMTYRMACRLVRSVGMDIEDGLALTFSCADYPGWVRDMNGWSVEDAARRVELKKAKRHQ